MVTESLRSWCERVRWLPDCLSLRKALALEEADELARRYLRHATHSGSPTVNSSTCTSRSSCGIGCACANRLAICCSIASRMFRRASSIDFPFEKQPGKVGLYA